MVMRSRQGMSHQGTLNSVCLTHLLPMTLSLLMFVDKIGYVHYLRVIM